MGIIVMSHISGTVTRRPSDEPETIAELHSAPLHLEPCDLFLSLFISLVWKFVFFFNFLNDPIGFEPNPWHERMMRTRSHQSWSKWNRKTIHSWETPTTLSLHLSQSPTLDFYFSIIIITNKEKAWFHLCLLLLTIKQCRSTLRDLASTRPRRRLVSSSKCN